MAPELVAIYRQAALLPSTRMGFLFQLRKTKHIVIKLNKVPVSDEVKHKITMEI